MRKIVVLVVLHLLLGVSLAVAQAPSRQKLRVKKDLLVILRDTTIITSSDTTLLLTDEQLQNVRIRPNPYLKSTQFYDTLRKRAGERKFTKDILDLIVKKQGRRVGERHCEK